jgi:membrane protein YdbS with pleckstrin-like domain
MAKTIEIKPSIFILASKIFLIIFIFDFLYIIVNLFFINIERFPQEIHKYIISTLFFLLIIKLAVELILLIKVVLNWLGCSYIFNRFKKHLVGKNGIFQGQNKVYDLKNVRSFEVDQSILGKLFNYGNIIIKTSASGGYQNQIFLIAVNSPKKCSQILKQAFS